MLRPGSMISWASEGRCARAAPTSASVYAATLGGWSDQVYRAPSPPPRSYTSNSPSAATGATDSANGVTSRICEPTCTCSPRMVSVGLASIRLMRGAASDGGSPNFDPTCPVITCSWVSATTPGRIRTSTSWFPPDGTVSSSRSTSSALSTTTSPRPCSTAIAISSDDFALPCRTTSEGSTPALTALRISPPPATSSPRPSSTITRCTAVAGNALDAKTTRERGHRDVSSVRYSRARDRSAASSTTSTGVPNSAASASARHPPSSSVPSSSRALPAGKSSRSESIPALSQNRRC